MKTLLKLQQNNKSIIVLYLAGLAFMGATTIFIIKTSVGEKDTVKTTKTHSVNTVTALSRIQPSKKVPQLASARRFKEAKIFQLFVKNDRINKEQTITLLNSYQRAHAAVKLAHQEVKAAQNDLAIIKAQAKQENINAQEANKKWIRTRLEKEIRANEAEIDRLKTQLSTEQAKKQVEIDRLKAELRKAKSGFRHYQELTQEGDVSRYKSSFDRLEADRVQNALFEAQSSYNLATFVLQQQIKRAQAIARQNKDTLEKQIIKAEAAFSVVDEVEEADVIQAQVKVDKAIAALRQAQENLELMMNTKNWTNEHNMNNKNLRR